MPSRTSAHDSRLWRGANPFQIAGFHRSIYHRLWPALCVSWISVQAGHLRHRKHKAPWDPLPTPIPSGARCYRSAAAETGTYTASVMPSSMRISSAIASSCRRWSRRCGEPCEIGEKIQDVLLILMILIEHLSITNSRNDSTHSQRLRLESS